MELRSNPAWFISAVFVAALLPSSSWATGRLMNTDPRCVQWSENILQENGSASGEQISQLVWCLTQEQGYFENGAARNALVKVGESAVPMLVEALESPRSSQAQGAALTLGDMGPKARQALPELKTILLKKNISGMLQPYAARAIGKIGDIDYLMSISQGKVTGIPRYLGYEGLGDAGPAAARAVPYLEDMLSKGSVYAGDALSKIGTPEAQATSRTYRWRKHLRETIFLVRLLSGLPLVSALIGTGFAVWACLGFRTQSRRRFANSLLFLPAVFWLLYYFCQKNHIVQTNWYFIHHASIFISILAAMVWAVDVFFRKD